MVAGASSSSTEIEQIVAKIKELQQHHQLLAKNYEDQDKGIAKFNNVVDVLNTTMIGLNM